MSFCCNAPVRAALVFFLCSFAGARTAEARKNGIQTTSCGGCHRSNGMASVVLAPDHSPILPGEAVSFTATITAPSIQVGGIYVAAPELGTLTTSAGEGLTLVDGSLTHSSPKKAENGSVTFDFTWTAPDEPGAVLLEAYAIAANGNNQNSGDTPGAGSLEFAFGCEPKTFYFDADNDMHGGINTLTKLGCAEQPPPRAYAPTSDDCDEAYATVYPGAPERCNGKDDNCNGSIDENTAPEPLYPDPDGDGFYGSSPGDSVIGCLPLAGYADEPGDCAPTEAGRHPKAEEVCDLKDDNCDGRIDEDVRPRCGVGRCAAESPTCDAADCQPGIARQEYCNGLDDDCNGIADDADDMCPEGQQCLGFRCVVIDDGSGSGASGGTAGTSGPSASGGTAAVTGMGAVTGAGGSGGASTTGPQGAMTSAENPSSSATAGQAAGCGLAARGRSSAASVALLLLACALVGRRRRGAGVRGLARPLQRATSHEVHAAACLCRNSRRDRLRPRAPAFGRRTEHDQVDVVVTRELDDHVRG